MKLGRVGVRLAELALAVVALTAALLASEVVIRAIDGYELWSIRLVRLPTGPIQNRANLDTAAGKHAARIPLAAGMDRAWLDLSPPPVPRKPLNPVFARIDTRYAETRLSFELFHVFNSSFIAQRMCGPYYSRFPGFFFIFDPPGGAEHPRYRFPLNEVTPIGLVTNQFGWRGPPIELRKAPNTIRIAFVGASTTVNNHSFPFSYPELAGFFLDKWAQAMFGVRVEIINAGREGITSTDIAAVVRDEVLPLEPDLVVYYEGSNQLNPGSIFRLSGDPGPRPNVSADVPDPDGGYFGRRSALVRRAQELRSTGVPEPRKPAYEVVWPSDVNEFDPPLGHKNLPAGLSTIMKDLDAIKAAAAGSGGELVVSSFFWLVYDGMRLDPVRHRYLYSYLNDTPYSYRYRDMERLAAFQNRVLEKFAADRGVLFMDIAATMPRDPDIFIDAVHATDVGVRLHAWIAAQKLVPWLRARIESGRLPRRARSELQAHPAFPGNERTLLFECSPDMRRARTVARVDLSKAMPQTSSARVEAGATLKVEIAARTRPHLYAARIPIVTTDPGTRFDDQHTLQVRPALGLQARIRVTGGDAQIGVLSVDEQSFLTYQTVAESKEPVSVDVALWSESVGPLIVAAGTTRPHDVVVELSDVSLVKVPAYSITGVLPGLSEPPP